MSLIKRILGLGATPTAAPAAAAPRAPSPVVVPSPMGAGPSEAPLVVAQAVADIVQVEEVRSAEFYAGDLFRRRFGGDPPDFPRHFVALYRSARAAYVSIGYIHYSAYEDCFLCGGMVIDDRAYRRIAAPHRALIRAAGGIAEIMLRQTFAVLADAPAIWGHVGDRQAEAVDLRVGFRRTRDPHVMVVWNHALTDEEKEARLERVIKLGAF